MQQFRLHEIFLQQSDLGQEQHSHFGIVQHLKHELQLHE